MNKWKESLAFNGWVSFWPGFYTSFLALLFSLSAPVITDFSVQRVPPSLLTYSPNTNVEEEVFWLRSELFPSSWLTQVSLERPFDSRSHFKESCLVISIWSLPGLPPWCPVSSLSWGNSKTWKTGAICWVFSHLPGALGWFEGCIGVTWGSESENMSALI